MVNCAKEKKCKIRTLVAREFASCSIEVTYHMTSSSILRFHDAVLN